LKKKNQKTFICFGQLTKVFCFFFFKKEVLPFSGQQDTTMLFRNLARAAVLLGAFTITSAQAEELRAALAKPLATAHQLLNAGRYPQAMAAVRQADAVPGKTAHEHFIIEEMRAAIAERSHDFATASAAYQRMLASGEVSGAQAARIYQAEASVTYSSGNYAAAVGWIDKYFKAGGSSPEMRTLQIQSLYLSKNFAEAGRLQAQVVAAQTRAGRIPGENELLLLYNCQKGSGDNAGALNTIKELVLYYQKPDYWRNVIDTLRAKQGFSDRLTFDVYRLEFSLGLVNSPADAMEMTELAVQAKLAGEAKNIVDKSFAGGPDAARLQRLKALVDQTYAAELAQLGKEDADAATDKDGNRLLGLGETYDSFGKFDKGIPLIKQAIAMGDLRHPEDAKLQLGIAYYNSGDKKDAISTLRSVRGTDGTTDLAQLWLLRIGK
jgi:Tfp pilus assembly protein PilF